MCVCEDLNAARPEHHPALTDPVLGSTGGSLRGAEPSRRLSRLLALCFHAELQILDESHRPERM